MGTFISASCVDESLVINRTSFEHVLNGAFAVSVRGMRAKSLSLEVNLSKVPIDLEEWSSTKYLNT
jgi:hypothetical protein